MVTSRVRIAVLGASGVTGVRPWGRGRPWQPHLV